MPGAVPNLPNGEVYMGRKEYDEKRNSRKAGSISPSHSDSDKLRKMFYGGLKAYEAKPLDKKPNPVWMTFNDRCQHPITNAKQLRALLDYYSHSDDVMVVSYHRDGCVSCGALDKVMEFTCREFKRHAPGLHFFDLNAGDDPVMVDGMRRFPQLKAFSSGNWQDIEFKPPQDFRDSVLRSVQTEMDERNKRGEPLTALQAEEMYFSVAAPAMAEVIEDSLWGYYNSARVRIHNYWKQLSIRRSWYFKRYIEPTVDKTQSATMRDASIFGEMRASLVPDALVQEQEGLRRLEQRRALLDADKAPMQQ
jgi:hypothetical protein